MENDNNNTPPKPLEDGIYLSICEITGAALTPLSLRRVNPKDGLMILSPKTIEKIAEAHRGIYIAISMISAALLKDYTREMTHRLVMAAVTDIKESLKEVAEVQYWESGFKSILEKEIPEGMEERISAVFSICSVEKTAFIPFCCTEGTIMSGALNDALQEFSKAQLKKESEERGISEEEVLKMVEKFKACVFGTGIAVEKMEEEEDPFKVTPEEEKRAVKEMVSNIKTLEQSLKEMERAIKETPDLSSEEQTPSSQYVEDTMDS